jgi:competence protein ComEC
VHAPLKLALLALACGGAGGTLGWLRPEPDELVFLAVGQGDCAVFRHAGVTVLVDAGPNMYGFDAGERIVLPKLRRMGVDRIDLVLLTHPDADHAGGLPALLRVHPKAAVASPASFRDDPALLQYLKEAGVPQERVVWLSGRSEARFGGARMQVSVPPWSEGDSLNEGSLFVRITNGTGSAVLSGDAGVATEAKMARLAGPWRSQVMTAGHHGSRTSTGDAWLDVVDPGTVVVSCGRANQYGHPHRSVLDRLEGRGIQVIRTDRQGDVRFVPSQAGFVRSDRSTRLKWRR